MLLYDGCVVDIKHTHIRGVWMMMGLITPGLCGQGQGHCGHSLIEIRPTVDERRTKYTQIHTKPHTEYSKLVARAAHHRIQ